MKVIYLALGSNIGDRRLNIHNAIEQLSQNGIHIKIVSSIIETDPVGGPPQRKFLNAVLKAETDLSPQKLLVLIKNIETSLGRTTSVRNGPRIIDIDILCFDNLNIKSSNLTIPHPRMHEREFVMAPLKEINPFLAEQIQVGAK